MPEPRSEPNSANTLSAPNFFPLHADARTSYLVEFRYMVLRSYGRTAESILKRAGKPTDIWKHVHDNPRRVSRILGTRYQKLTPLQADDIRRRWGRPPGSRVRVETTLWAAARLLASINAALPAIEESHNVDLIRRLDRGILAYGTALIDAMQARAARSYRSKEIQRGSAQKRSANVRAGDGPKSYARIAAALDFELMDRRRRGLSETGTQKKIAKRFGVSEATVTRAKNTAKLPADPVAISRN